MPTNKQQRETARRELQQQLARRQEAAARRRKTTLGVTIGATVLVIALVVGLVIAFTGGPSSSPSAAGSSSASAPVGFTTCSYASSGDAAKPNTAPDAQEPDTGTVTLDVATTQGAMTFSLDRSLAPCSVAALESLASQQFYDNTPCPRVVTSGIFVLQCGDPTGTGSGGPGYTVQDEATGSEQYPAGTIAMARSSGPNTTGSQFFIVYQDSPSLMQNLGAQQYTVVGTVSAGLDVVTKVAAAGDDGTNPAGGGAPKLPIDLTSVTVADPGSSSAATDTAAPTDTTASDTAAPSGASGSPAG